MSKRPSKTLKNGHFKMAGGNMMLIKYLMIFFNLIFFASGLALIAIGVSVQSEYGDHFNYADSRFASAEIFIIVIGAIVLSIGFFGCCGALKENYFMICVFTVSLVIIFGLEITAGILGYEYRGKVATVANKAFDDAIANYDQQEGGAHLLDWAQGTLKCCGKLNSHDYDKKEGNRTVSVCGAKGQGVPSCHEGRVCSGLLHREGCMTKVVDFAKKKLYVIGGVAVGVAFIEVLGVFLAVTLLKAIKNREAEYTPVY